MTIPLQGLFKSFYLGGFECSTHRIKSGKRLDLIAATRHDAFADADYMRLADFDIQTAREGVRWHLVEQTPGVYDFSSAVPIVQAAQKYSAQIVWDLLHFGWPDDVDVFQPSFIDRFAKFAGAFAGFLKEHFDEPLHICPVNEVSYLSWIGGEAGGINPFAEGRGFELKCQLVRATIAAAEAIWDRDPSARMHQIEPVFNVIAQADRPHDVEAAEGYRQLQFQTWDLLAGRVCPEVGGAEKYLDVIGLNYYPWNQWYYAGPLHGGATIDDSVPGYRRFADMVEEVWRRYQRPLYLAETGREGDSRPAWLSYVSEEIRVAMERGIPVEGVCLYPIVNFPGWEDERHCHNGMWDYADDNGERELYGPLADELRRQTVLMRSFLNVATAPARRGADISVAA